MSALLPLLPHVLLSCAAGINKVTPFLGTVPYLLALTLNDALLCLASDFCFIFVCVNIIYVLLSGFGGLAGAKLNYFLCHKFQNECTKMDFHVEIHLQNYSSSCDMVSHGQFLIVLNFRASVLKNDLASAC